MDNNDEREALDNLRKELEISLRLLIKNPLIGEEAKEILDATCFQIKSELQED